MDGTDPTLGPGSQIVARTLKITPGGGLVLLLIVEERSTRRWAFSVAAAIRKERAQQVAGHVLAQAGIKLGPVVAGYVAEDAGPMLDAAAFWIGRSVVEACDARERDGGSAHGARLKRDVKIMSREPLGARCLAGRADGQDLGVRR